MLLSIGEISAMVNISKDALRYYDEVGILKPHMIDQDNGYRYYDEHQIKTILLILDYKYYGFALEEIKWLLVCEDSELLKSTLAKQYERIIKQINDLEEKANRLKMKVFKNGGNNMDEKKILIVDDAKFMREILKEILEKNGYSTIAAQDGEEALRRYQDESPDLVYGY